MDHGVKNGVVIPNSIRHRSQIHCPAISTADMCALKMVTTRINLHLVIGIVCVAIAVALVSCCRPRVHELGSAVQTDEAFVPLRDQQWQIWVVTNGSTGDAWFALNTLATGFIPKRGEATFNSVDELVALLQSGKYGVVPRIVGDFEGDLRGETNYGVRELNTAERENLMAKGIQLLKGD